jgi:ATP-dependent DNA helicase RecG
VQVADLNADLIANYRSRTGARGTTQKLLAARSLLTHKKELTNAGYLLFAPHPQQLFPQAYIRIIKFLTTERGTGARFGIQDDLDNRVEGPIPRAIQEASRVMEELVPKRRSLDAFELFESRPIVPRDAYLEGLLNAVIHRSYPCRRPRPSRDLPRPHRDRKPRTLPGLANPIAPLEISRFARNPRIARVCADLRIGQELGWTERPGV